MFSYEIRALVALFAGIIALALGIVEHEGSALLASASLFLLAGTNAELARREP